MHRNYATLFDSKFANRGLAMYESLAKHSSEPFTLHILTLDSSTFWLLDEMALPNVVLTEAHQFESKMDMLKLKATRTVQEYCWTCASHFMLYLDLPKVTYLDADLFFLSDPKAIFDEIGYCEIGIVPHRLIPSKKHLEVNGRFNVGWVTIDKGMTGRVCLHRWASQVREWCFNRIEGDHACGDQKYLDEWPLLYGQQVCIIQNIGANLAPWNLANYTISERNGDIYANDTRVSFFHTHEFKDENYLSGYMLRFQDMVIYRRYLEAISAANVRIAEAQKRMQAVRA